MQTKPRYFLLGHLKVNFSKQRLVLLPPVLEKKVLIENEILAAQKSRENVA